MEQGPDELENASEQERDSLTDDDQTDSGSSGGADAETEGPGNVSVDEPTNPTLEPDEPPKEPVEKPPAP